MPASSVSHTDWDCNYHILFIPKHRDKLQLTTLEEGIVSRDRRLCRPNFEETL